MQTRVLGTLAAARMDYAVSPPGCVTLLKQRPPCRIAPFPLLSAATAAHTHVPFLGCGPLRHTPSAAQSAVFCCQANKWLVSEAVSVYRLPILSLFWGLKGRLSLGDGQSPGFIDFFPSPLFVRSVQTVDLKDRRDHTHAAAPSWWSTTALCFFVFFSPLKGEDEDERQCEWKMIGETQSKASAASFPLPPHHHLHLPHSHLTLPSFHSDTEKILYTE